MTDPVTLTRAEVIEELCAWGGEKVIAMVDRLVELWPNGVRIVPDPAPEPGPEVRYVDLTKGDMVNTFKRHDRTGPELWMRAGNGGFVDWNYILESVDRGWTLTEYVAKDGAK